MVSTWINSIQKITNYRRKTEIAGKKNAGKITGVDKRNREADWMLAIFKRRIKEF